MRKVRAQGSRLLPKEDQTKSKRKRSRKTNDNKVSRSENLMKEVLEETTFKPWLELPNEPNAKACKEYIASIDQIHDEELRGFTRQWLAKADAAWPTCANTCLERFMHTNNVYISSVDQGTYETPGTIAFATQLRLGTEIQTIDQQDVAVYSRRFFEQVKALSFSLVGGPHFLLHFDRHQGILRKTDKFERMWERRYEYWSIGPPTEEFDDEDLEPSKKRRRSKPLQSDTCIRGDPENVERIQQSDLARKAACALALEGTLPDLPECTIPPAIEHGKSGLPMYNNEDVTMVDRPSLSSTSYCDHNSSVSFDLEAGGSSCGASATSPTPQPSESRRKNTLGRTRPDMDGSSMSSSNTRKQSLILKLGACARTPLTTTSLTSPNHRSPRVKTESPGGHISGPPYRLQGGSKETLIVLGDEEESETLHTLDSRIGDDSGDQDMDQGNGEQARAAKIVKEMVRKWNEDRDRHRAKSLSRIATPEVNIENDGSTNGTVPPRQSKIVTSTPSNTSAPPAQLEMPHIASTRSTASAPVSIPSLGSKKVIGNPGPGTIHTSNIESTSKEPVGKTVERGSDKHTEEHLSRRPSSPHDSVKRVREQVLGIFAADSDGLPSVKSTQTLDTILQNGPNVLGETTASTASPTYGQTSRPRTLGNFDVSVSSGIGQKSFQTDPDPACAKSPQTEKMKHRPDDIASNVVQAKVETEGQPKSYQEKLLELKQKLSSAPSSPTFHTPSSPDRAIQAPNTEQTPQASVSSPPPPLRSGSFIWIRKTMPDPPFAKEPVKSETPPGSALKEPYHDTSSPSINSGVSTSLVAQPDTAPPPLGSKSNIPLVEAVLKSHSPSTSVAVNTSVETRTRNTPALPPQAQTPQPKIEPPTLWPKLPATVSAADDTAMPKVYKSPYAIVPTPTPSSTKPSPSDQPTIPDTKPNLERSPFNPITLRDPNFKTLELVIALEDGSINFDNAFPFQHAENHKLEEFFDFCSTVSQVPIFRLKSLTLTLAFGKRQNFSVQRTGDLVKDEQLWKKTKNIILVLFKNAQKVEKDQDEFQVLVEVEMEMEMEE
ncbi:uncharacterized protein LY89DRAFT_360971 [Mollisia scopiformis]|uniref:Uncharacterized protein n=1 Tax=Mollisia scopiformis TaxID=149040 RepID=A0A132B5J3_MOLSC|nr:uncharacterized protein LY89DRAFT_360971 [Mollisia scopiformis]KUJ07259.1 hypothetical protein LY89DRAFT_360971 [Mollisia scopiformis]